MAIPTWIRSPDQTLLPCFANRDSKVAQEEAMSEVAALEGDHISLVNLYAAYLEAGKSPQWCQERFINHRSLQR